MRRRALLMLSLAALLGLVAVLLARNWISNQTQQVILTQDVSPAMSSVVVASRDLYFGDVLTRDYLEEIPWPAANLPTGAFSTIEEVLAGEDQRVALRHIETNEMVLSARISGFGGRATLSSLIGEDMRAVTVRVNDVVGVAGFVLPGDRVDVVLTRDEAQRNVIAEVILSNVKVLAVDQEADDLRDSPVVARAVTVEVNPRDAQKLALASQIGNLTLALRGASDVAAVALPRMDVNELGILGPQVAHPLEVRDVQPAAPVVTTPVAYTTPTRPSQVQVYRGTERSTENVVLDRGTPVTTSPASQAPTGSTSGWDTNAYSAATMAPTALVPQNPTGDAVPLGGLSPQAIINSLVNNR